MPTLLIVLTLLVKELLAESKLFWEGDVISLKSIFRL